MGTLRNRIALVALVAGSCMCPAVAGNLYRCISPQGLSSYQQAPNCPPGYRLARTIAYQAEPDSKGAPAVFKPSRVSTLDVSDRSVTKRRKRQPTASERCRAAKEQREHAFRKLGLKRTYDDLGRLDAPVREACRW